MLDETVPEAKDGASESFGRLGEFPGPIGLARPMITGLLEGRHLFAFNPRGHSGVVFLSGEAREFFEILHRDATNGWCAIAALYERNSERATRVLRALADAELVVVGERHSTQLAARRRLARKIPRTLHLWLQVTDACNLRCRYCFVPHAPVSISASLAKETVRTACTEARAHGFDRVIVKLAGGEPMLVPDVCREVVEWAASNLAGPDLDVRFAFLTNGTIVSDELLDTIRAFNCGVSVSLDGIDHYNDVGRPRCDGSASFSLVSGGIDKLLTGGVRPFVLVTVGADNVSGLPTLAAYCIERNLRFRLSPRRTEGQSEDEVDGIADGLVAFYGWLGQNLPRASLYRLHKFAWIDLLQPRRHVCGLGTVSAVVGAKGEVRLCPQYGRDRVIGNVRTTGILGALAVQEEVRLDHGGADGLAECRECSWRYTCGGGCPLHAVSAGRALGSRSPHCRLLRRVMPALLEVHARQLITDCQS